MPEIMGAASTLADALQPHVRPPQRTCRCLPVLHTVRTHLVMADPQRPCLCGNPAVGRLAAHLVWQRGSVATCCVGGAALLQHVLQPGAACIPRPCSATTRALHALQRPARPAAGRLAPGPALLECAPPLDGSCLPAGAYGAVARHNGSQHVAPSTRRACACAGHESFGEGAGVQAAAARALRRLPPRQHVLKQCHMLKQCSCVCCSSGYLVGADWPPHGGRVL